MQEKENSSGSPEKQVDKEAIEEQCIKFSCLYKILKQPSKIGTDLIVDDAFSGKKLKKFCSI